MTEFLIWFIASFISTFGVAYLYYKLSKCQKISKISILLIILGTVFVSILKFFDLKLLSSISYFLFYPLLFYCLNNSNLKKLLFYLVIIWLYGMFFDFLSMLVLSVLNLYFDFDIYNYMYIILPSVFSSIMLISISRFSFINRATDALYKSFAKIEFTDYMLFIFIIYVFILGLALAINIENISIDLLIVSLFIITLLFVILFIKNRLDKYENHIFLDTLKENNNFYISMDAENSIFKHNLMAKLLSIKSVSNKRARQMIDELLYEFNSNIDFSRHMHDIPYGLNGIIYQKLYPFLEQLNIKIDNQIQEDIFELLKARRYNVFVEKMIIALDNAIESSLKSVEKLLVINLYTNNSEIILEIKNSFGSDLNIDNIGNLNYSTKGNRRGLGLFSALRNKEALMSLKVINDLFVVKITAKKKV